MKRVLALFVVLVSGAWSCHNPTPTPVPPSAVDAAPPIADTPCAAYCQLGTKLGCTWAQPTAAGASCIDVCRNANNPAGPIQFDFACRNSKTSCDDIAKCQ